MSAVASPARSRSAWLRPAGLLVLLLVMLVLAGCASRKTGSTAGGGHGPGGYPVGAGDYRRDGPHDNPPANLHAVPDAVPRIEPLASGPNRPYVINGRRYVPDTTGGPYRARGRASWYGRQFHGRPTSSGEPYDMYAMTAAHPTLPIPSYARVTKPSTGRSVIVRINDRGPFVDDRVIDLSYVAAYKLGTLNAGTGEVIVERILPDEIQRGLPPQQVAPPMIASAPPPAEAPAPPSTWRASGAAAAAAPPAPAPAAAPMAADAPADELPNLLASLTIPVPEAPPVASAPSPTPAPAAAPPAPSPTASAGYSLMADGAAFLQLGAFGEARNAHALVERLQPRIAGMGRLEVVNQGDNVYKVQLGPFTDRNSAVANVDAVFGQTGIMPHVVAR